MKSPNPKHVFETHRILCLDDVFMLEHDIDQDPILIRVAFVEDCVGNTWENFTNHGSVHLNVTFEYSMVDTFTSRQRENMRHILGPIAVDAA